MKSEPRLAKEAVAQHLNHLIAEELRVICAYNILISRLRDENATQTLKKLEVVQRHHTETMAKLHATVQNYGLLPSRNPTPNEAKQSHLRLVAQASDCLPELIWLETELIREYQKTRQLILSETERHQILDPAIESMEINLAMLKRL